MPKIWKMPDIRKITRFQFFILPEPNIWKRLYPAPGGQRDRIRKHDKGLSQVKTRHDQCKYVPIPQIYWKNS